MNSRTLPPYSTLPPHLWSRIFSLLSPNDLSKASEAILPRDETFDVAEDASRIAVESMIRIAAMYFRETPPEEEDEDVFRQKLHPGLELERFVQTQNSECTTKATISETRKAFCSYTDQNWQGIYKDMHMIIDYLSFSGFSKDQPKMIAIAVQSIYLMSDDAEYCRDEH